MNEIDIRMKLKEIYWGLSEKFNFSYNDYPTIIISNRLRCRNGRCLRKRDTFSGEVRYCKITMSKALLDEFGWERFEKTFRHEVAHLANALLYRGKGHDKSFKRLCRDFGGSMNPKMAGYTYSDCASTDYIKPIIKYIYTCPCGLKRKMAKRMSYKKRGNPNYYCRKCRITLDKWKEIRV